MEIIDGQTDGTDTLITLGATTGLLSHNILRFASENELLQSTANFLGIDDALCEIVEVIRDDRKLSRFYPGFSIVWEVCIFSK